MDENKKWAPRAPSRLRHYDYSSPGFYFITFCTAGRERWLGSIVAERAVLSQAGQLVKRVLLQTTIHYPAVLVDCYIIMPDHIHVLFHYLPQDESPGPRAPITQIAATLKSLAAKKLRQARLVRGRKVWQRGYHDRVIRDEDELGAARLYIRQNPLRWSEQGRG